MRSKRCRDCREEVVWWALAVNIGQSIYKGLLGLLSGSSALVADAMHSGADVVATLVTIVSLKLSNRKADSKYQYGYGNVQFISSSVVGLILILGALYLMYESVLKIMSGEVNPPSIVAVLGAVVSVATNELMYRYQSCVGRENNSPAIIANAWDNRSDALSSLAVLVGIIVAVAGFPIADNLAAIGVAVLVAKIGVELNIDAVHGLMDTSVEMDVLVSAYNIAKATPMVQDVQHLRGRNVGEAVNLDISVCVSGDLKIYESDLIAEAVRKGIMGGIDHVTDVHVSVVPAREMTGKARRAGRTKGVPAIVH